MSRISNRSSMLDTIDRVADIHTGGEDEGSVDNVSTSASGFNGCSCHSTGRARVSEAPWRNLCSKNYLVNISAKSIYIGGTMAVPPTPGCQDEMRV